MSKRLDDNGIDSADACAYGNYIRDERKGEDSIRERLILTLDEHRFGLSSDGVRWTLRGMNEEGCWEEIASGEEWSIELARGRAARHADGRKWREEVL